MPSPSVVLDTNILVSGHLRTDGLERFVLDMALSRRLQLFYSASIIEEYEGVLSRPKFHIAPAKFAELLALLRSSGRRVIPKRKLQVAIDPDDDIFLECAEAAQAQYIVTGNKKHFPDAWGVTRIVNTREFLNEVLDELKR
jgi:putative PIN family toxin of toxin-antitoxin system